MTFQIKWCLLLFFSNNIISTLSTCDDDLYLIRTTNSALVLDGNNGILTIQYFTGYSPQLWKFKKGNRPGLFYIINSSTGTVLDVDRTNGDKVILSPERASLQEQWFLHNNGRIVNAGMNINLNVHWGKFVPGTPLYVIPDNGNEAQEFSVNEKKTCPQLCTGKYSQNNPNAPY